MTRVAVLLAIALLLAWPVRARLVHARWTALAPRAAIVLWQAIGLAFGVAVLGACFELACSPSDGVGLWARITDLVGALVANRPAHALTPGQLFGLTAGLLIATPLFTAVAPRAVRFVRARDHHRMLVDLVDDEWVGTTNVLVLEHPQAIAYSLAGMHSRVVVSSGAIEALSDDEILAVLAHERAHLHARHDLVLLPFRSLSSVLPASEVLAAVNRHVRGLIEMAADDCARRECEPGALARALCRLATTGVPSVALGASSDNMAVRVERVLSPRPSAKLVALGSGLSAIGVVALPLVAILLTLGGR